MTARLDDDVRDEMLGDLVVEGADDWVMLGSVDITVRTVAARHEIQLGFEDRISVGLDLIHCALARGLMVAGDVRDADGFVPWDTDQATTLDRIERGWRAAGERLEMGDVVWLANTDAGDAYAERVVDEMNNLR